MTQLSNLSCTFQVTLEKRQQAHTDQLGVKGKLNPKQVNRLLRMIPQQNVATTLTHCKYATLICKYVPTLTHCKYVHTLTYCKYVPTLTYCKYVPTLTHCKYASTLNTLQISSYFDTL